MGYAEKYSYIFIFFILTACGGGGGGGSSSGTCTDGSSSSFCTSEFKANYGLINTKAYEAFDDGYNGSGTKVAVLDGGFDVNHAELDSKMLTGYNVLLDNNDADSDSHNETMGGHGTHVAGIIAAERNGTGMMGIAYNAEIIPIKIFLDSGSAMNHIAKGIDFGTDNGAIALNNSWGTSRVVSASCGGVSCYTFAPGESSKGGFTLAEENAWKGVASDNNVVVFAAGNDGNNSETGSMPFYYTSNNGLYGNFSPSSLVNSGILTYSNRSSQEAQFATQVTDVADNWLNVVAVDNNNTIASWSNGCGNTKAYCIAAPGVDIYSSVPTELDASGYDTMSGTSMAAPHVSGAIAVMRDKWPNLTGAQIVDLIISSATDLGAAGTDEVYGVGLLNMAGAMTATAAQSFSYVDENGSLKKIQKEGSSISVNSVLSNLATNNANIGIVDGYDRVYSNKSSQFNTFKSNSLTDQQNFFKYRNGFTEAQLANSYFSTLSMGHVNYGIDQRNFDLNYRSYPFQEDKYQNIFLGDNVINLGLVGDSIILASNLLDKNNSYLIKSNFTSFNKKSKSSLTLGYGYEQDGILNSEFTGAFETKNNTTLYANFIHDQKVSEKNNLFLKIGYGVTKTNFINSDFFNTTDIITSESAIGYVHRKDESKFAVSLEAPLSVNSGKAYYYSVSGYDSNGNYKNGSQVINLKNNHKDVSFNLYYDKILNENTNYGIEFNQFNSGSTNIQIIFSKVF